MRLAAILGLVALAALMAGCSTAEPNGAPTATPPPATSTPAPEPATHSEQWNLGPRDSRELNFGMRAGDSVHYELDAGATVRWDLHSHTASGAVTTHDSGEGREASGDFTAPTDGVYSIFARATGATAVTTVSLEGSFDIVE